MQRAYLVGIEIRIEDDNSVCAPQVDTDSSRSRGEKIHEDIGPRTIELVHAFLSLRLFRVSVLTWNKGKLNGDVRFSLTSRKNLIPSPSRKSSIISRAMTNCQSCIDNRMVSMRGSTYLAK